MAAPADAAAHVPAVDDISRRRLGWAGIGVAGLAFLSGLVVATILGSIYASARGLSSTPDGDLGFGVATSLGLWTGFLVLPVLWSRRHGGPARYLGLAARWVDLPLGLGVGLGSTLVTGIISSLLLTSSQQKVLEDKAQTIIDRGQGVAAIVLVVVVLCVATPLAEEVFFRGLVFRSLHRIAPLAAALVLGGLVFGVVHYDGKPAPGIVIAVQIGMLALFGLALCALAHRTGRLAAGIVAHAAFNAVTVISLVSRR